MARYASSLKLLSHSSGEDFRSSLYKQLVQFELCSMCDDRIFMYVIVATLHAECDLYLDKFVVFM
jgi:hypothetical protein